MTNDNGQAKGGTDKAIAPQRISALVPPAPTNLLEGAAVAAPSMLEHCQKLARLFRKLMSQWDEIPAEFRDQEWETARDYIKMQLEFWELRATAEGGTNGPRETPRADKTT